MAVARGKIDVPACRSTSITGTRYLDRPIAVTSPAGPAPTTRTPVVVTPAATSAVLGLVVMASHISSDDGNAP